jgi:hypothetical protein
MSEEDSNLSQDSDEYRRWKAGEDAQLCPRGCKGSLTEQEGLLMCNECDGAKVSVEMLAEGTRDTLLQFIRMGKESELNCVLCNKKMSEIELQYDPNQVADFEPLMGLSGRVAMRDVASISESAMRVSGEHPIFILITLAMISGEIVNAASHVAKKSAASMKKKVTSTITLDGCASCESMWFDGKKYSSPTGSYNHEIEILERFWTSTKKSAAINRLDEKKTEEEKSWKTEMEERKRKDVEKGIVFDNRPYWQRYDNL